MSRGQSWVQSRGGCEAGGPEKPLWLVSASASSSRGRAGVLGGPEGWHGLWTVPLRETLEGFQPEPPVLLGPLFPRNVLEGEKACTHPRARVPV